MTTVTANGRQYSDDGATSRDMQNGGHRVYLLPMLSDAMVEVAAAKTAKDAALASATAAQAANNAFGVTAGSPTTMTVTVGAGGIFDGNALVQKAAQVSAVVVKPVTYPRIDRVVCDEVTGVIAIIAGAEAAAPVAPAIPAGKFPLARIALTTTTTAITDAMITDERACMPAAIMPGGGSMTGALVVQPATAATHPVQALQLQAQSLTAFTSAGTAAAMTLTPVPALAALVAGRRFRVKFHVASVAAATLNISGLGAKSLKQYSSDGVKVDAMVAANQLSDVEYDGVDMVVLNPLPARQYAPGIVVYYAGSPAPTGFMTCNGAAISRTVYADLFAVLGVSQGAGDGSTTFNLPDYRAEFLRGADMGRGVDAGRVFGTWQIDSIGTHTHGALVAGNNGSNVHAVTNVGDAPLYLYSGTTTASGGSETRPRNIALMPCISY